MKNIKEIDKTRNYFIKKNKSKWIEKKHNEWIRRVRKIRTNKKHKNICRFLNYIEHLLILNFTVTRCVSISVFASLAGISIGITSSAIILKIGVITAGIQ